MNEHERRIIRGGSALQSCVFLNGEGARDVPREEKLELKKT